MRPTRPQRLTRPRILHAPQLAVAQQLGRVDALKTSEATIAQPHDCSLNGPSWGWTPAVGSATALVASVGDELTEVTKRKTLAYGFPTPAAKEIVMRMDAVISDHVYTYDWPAWSAVRHLPHHS